MSNIESRTRPIFKRRIQSPGPYKARITNNLDKTRMGAMEVSFQMGAPDDPNVEELTGHAYYLPPFWGTMNQLFEGSDPRKFEDVQKSYGIWMVPPDIGTTVLVIFVDGDLLQGYILGCIPDTYQNHMVPGIAASNHAYLSPEQQLKYQTSNLPVAEFLMRNIKSHPMPGSQYRPVHPFADRLLAQGLLVDNIRGITSSSARREIPSNVYGISTPGPLDLNGRKAAVGYDKKVLVPITRLGGTQFVMDDGKVDKKTGKIVDELVRIRTRTGHQILMHNSSDLIYIANSKGTAWIELTSNGKIDIYAADSVSIHTEADFNFRADRDINIEAGRNINIRALGNMEKNIAGYYNLIVDDYAKISIAKNKDETIGKDLKLSVGNNLNVVADRGILATAGAGVDVSAEGDMKLSTAGTLNLGASGNIIATGSKIHLNGPSAAAAASAELASLPPQLPTFSLPNRNVKNGWSNGVFYKDTPINSIMQRVPTHEPWDQHENINPSLFSSLNTDVTVQSRASSGIPDTAAVSTAPSANLPEVLSGTCEPRYAKDIAAASSQAGISQLKSACEPVGLNTPISIASLLAITGGESKWQIQVEKFNYSASRLLTVFPSIFKGDLALAQEKAADPSKLPEFLYGPPPFGSPNNQYKSLGNINAGDGSKFIGRGYIQITGRSNYTKYSKLLYDRGLLPSVTSLVDSPDLLNDPKISAYVSAIYIADRVKLSQTDPGYFEAAVRAVGYCTPDIYATKKGYYECFLGQLQGKPIPTYDSSPPLTDSAGTTVGSTDNPTASSTLAP